MKHHGMKVQKLKVPKSMGPSRKDLGRQLRELKKRDAHVGRIPLTTKGRYNAVRNAQEINMFKDQIYKKELIGPIVKKPLLFGRRKAMRYAADISRIASDEIGMRSLVEDFHAHGKVVKTIERENGSIELRFADKTRAVWHLDRSSKNRRYVQEY